MSSVAQKEKSGAFLKDLLEAVLFFAGLALLVITIVGMMEMSIVRYPPEHTLQSTQERSADEQQQLQAGQ